MAGTLPGIPLSQQFSAAGKPLAGCLLYVYAANTTTPQDSYLDQGLTIKNPWPMAADGSGRVPMFYLADGSVHVRLTDSGGVVQFDYPSMLVIGPSAGGGGGGGGVDPTTVFQTGDCIWIEQTGIRAGWVRDNGKTIGNGASGATERANADCQNLYIYLWNLNRSDCPVTGGRGSSGLNDFNAPKQLQLPDKRGYSPAGDTSMGNTDLANLAGVPFTGGANFGNSSTPGSKGGEATHTLLKAEAPTGLYALNFTDPQHSHGITFGVGSQPIVNSGGGQFGASGGSIGNTTMSINNASTGISASLTDNAGNGAHNITGLIVIGSYYRKL